MVDENKVVQIKNLVKEFPSVTAVNDVSFDIEKGEIYGLLGRNGAGKTTTMRILLDLVRPTQGGILLFGEQWQDAILRRRIGYLPEFPVRYPHLTPNEYLEFSARLLGIELKIARKRSEQLIDTVGLTSASKRRMRGFSKGMFQRIGLAQALLNDPDLLILDEPTAGLDPLGHRLVKDIVEDLAERGKTVIISSHLLAEIESGCHRVAIMENGKLISEGAIGDLLEVTRNVEVIASNLKKETRKKLEELAIHLSHKGDKIVMELGEDVKAGDIARMIVGSGADLTHFTSQRRTLEDLFISLVGDNQSGDETAPKEATPND